jgi:hypothetical protein
MTRLRLAVVPAIAALAMLTAPATSLASCIQPPPIEQALRDAEIVFVGTVISTENGDRWATVEIEEIWKGPDQPASVLVKGGPGGGAATSIDRTFQIGVKYLFLPSPDGATLVDNACTSTTPWSDGLQALRPAGARAPLAATEGESGFDFGAIMAPVGVALAVAAVLLLIGLAARSRQPG